MVATTTAQNAPQLVKTNREYVGTLAVVRKQSFLTEQFLQNFYVNLNPIMISDRADNNLKLLFVKYELICVYQTKLLRFVLSAI